MYIVFLVNFVGVVGFFYKFVLEICLVYKNGSLVLIIVELYCYILDDVLKFNNFFCVIMIDGMFFVVVNSDGMVGFGELFVYVINV